MMQRASPGNLFRRLPLSLPLDNSGYFDIIFTSKRIAGNFILGGIMKKTLLALLVASICSTGICIAAEKAFAIDGAEILEKRCSVCHPSAKPKGAKKSKDQWAATVTRMVEKGAKLSADEKKALIDHLAKTYKP